MRKLTLHTGQVVLRPRAACQVHHRGTWLLVSNYAMGVNVMCGYDTGEQVIGRVRVLDADSTGGPSVPKFLADYWCA